MAKTSEPGAEAWVPETSEIEVLAHAANGCRGCELYRDSTQAVFSAGPSDARLMLVGEQPGDREDIEGKPFVGPAGKLLAEALDAAGIPHDQAYVTNAVKHFRFEERGKRRIHKNPGVTHINACHPWLEAELAIVKPEVVVALGGTAGRAVLGRTVKVTTERGHALEGGPDGATVFLTTHPSAVLRLRGEPEFDEAFDGLVRDLARAVAALT
ncbi:UdgX family uracil-DNA binding protein [Desertivibrio insolitus]|uniref:UdgX family uracil-DNA binding protein n=1 Tax=Herbiconiux sp. SYSU D00978 TaxID=2812562 RepID=UPI001A95EA51|nr:UdgX family uracil-DNA binding protein [Herbiconiux sp. SYSU D00978]